MGLGRPLSEGDGAASPRGEPTLADAAGPPAPFVVKTLGRYVLLGRIGEGGMGVVYAAYDPELDRKVALKVLRPLATGRAPEDLRARFVHEAQAMARLSDPHVVPVHEVGTAGDDVFLAMELVDGTTLRAWAASEPRSWRTVLEAYLQAGRGLAAAHAVGVVHRDFKPDNVLVRRDGRVQVADFGLAITSAPRTSDVRAPGSDPRVGTPAYMAPEQLEGGVADARSDQFSFCVALHEALFGERPFPGRTFEEVSASQRRGPVRAEGARRVPRRARRRVHAIVARGLRLPAGERFPSMGALLAALEAVAARPRNVARGVVATVTLAATLAVATTRALAPSPCPSLRATVEQTWSSARRAAVERAFLATARPYAADAARKVASSLDAYAAAWLSMQHDACEATRVRGEQSEALFDLRMLCLRRRLAEMRSLVGAFEAADEALVQRAPAAVDALSPLVECADEAALTGPVPMPGDPAARRRIEDLYERVSVAGALQYAGRFADARDAALAVVTAPESGGYAPLRARAALRVGLARLALADASGAADALHDAVLAGLEGRDDEAIALARAHLVVVNTDLVRYDRAEVAIAEARALARRLGASPSLAHLLDRNEGVLRKEQGRLELAEQLFGRALSEAQTAHGPESNAVTATLDELVDVQRLRGELEAAQRGAERATELAVRIHGPDHPRVAAAYHELGVVAYNRGDYAAAQAHLEKAVALREKLYGEDHPKVAVSLEALGVTLHGRGSLEAALAVDERALRLAEREHGPEHPAVASLLSAQGGVYDALGRIDDALAVNLRAVAIRERTLGPEHPDVAQNLGNIGISLKRRGRFTEALPYYERSLRILKTRLGGEHPQVGAMEHNLGELLRTMGRLADAQTHYERALEVWGKALPPDHPFLAHPLTGLGQVAVARKQGGLARELLTRALRLREASCPPHELGETRFALARALALLPGQRNEAREQALAAARSYREVAGGYARELAEVHRFLQMTP